MTPSVQSSNSIQPPACGFCGKTDVKLKTCSRCHFEKYCGVECQKKHYPIHKRICLKKLEETKLWKLLAQKEKSWNGPESEPGPLLKKVGISSQNLKEFWGSFSTEYDALHVPVLLKQYFSPTLENGVEKQAIDLGSSIGDLSFYLLERRWKVVAIDFSKEALAKMEKRALELNNLWLKTEQLVIKEEDILNYSFPIQTVDLILANDIFPYCNPSKIELLLKKIHIALKEEGLLLSAFFPKPKDLNFRKGLKEMGAWFLNEKEIKTLITASGFQCIDFQKRKGQTAFDFIAKKLST